MPDAPLEIAAGETAKQRAGRIPFNYPDRTDPYIRRRIGLTGVALGIAVAWLAWGSVRPEIGLRRASHGLLARTHAAWDAKCNVCHPPGGVWEALSGRVVPIVSTDADNLCMKCHLQSSKDSKDPHLPHQGHHPATTSQRVPHCAECHRDHAGREASLVRLGEAVCTTCHSNLASPPDGKSFQKPNVDRTVAHFADESHPEIRPSGADPGKIKFNHFLHMRPHRMWGDKDRNSRPDQGPPQLTCANCHRLDSESGLTFAPIQYEAHCKSCHELDLPAGPIGARGVPDANPVRHGQKADELFQSLETIYVQVLINAKAPDLQELLKSGPVPGRRRDGAATGQAEVERRAKVARTYLFGHEKNTCTECHYYTENDGGPVHEFADDLDLNTVEVADPAIPKIWLPYARFDHSAHKGVDCRECHARAFADDPNASGRPATMDGGQPRLKDGSHTWTSHKDVLLPEKATCVRCHAPAASSGSGGAGFACTECHTYHNGDRPFEGRGALARDPVLRRSIEQFLGTATSNPPGRSGNGMR